MYVPNCRKRKIHELMIASTTCEDMITKEVLLGKLVGRLSEASQIEPKYKGKKDFLSKLKNKIQKENKKNSETVSTYEMLRST